MKITFVQSDKENPIPTLLDGTLANLPGTGYIQLVVEPPATDEEG